MSWIGCDSPPGRRELGHSVEPGFAAVRRPWQWIRTKPTQSKLDSHSDCSAIMRYSRDNRTGGCIVASITVRNLDEGLKRRLRIRAAENGHSMEQEARDILRAAKEPVPTKKLGTAIHELFKPFGGVELEIPPREPVREPPQLD